MIRRVLMTAGFIGMLFEPTVEATWIHIAVWYPCCLALIGVGYILHLKAEKDDIQCILDKDPIRKHITYKSKKSEWKDFIMD